MDADTFGAWGQWAGAIMSFFAVVVALGIAIRDGRVRADERADQVKAQARTVTVDVRKLKSDRWHYHWTSVVVENHGTLPITEITLTRLVVKTNGREVAWELKIDSKGYTSKALPHRLAKVLGPGEQGEYGSLRELVDGPEVRFIQPEEAYAEVTFVDAAGLRWSRTTENREPQRVIEK
ncbi:hypothetical protein [Amycolatopsis sp. NPDC006125]|uniref:hypothetical protein n=1 Tax=Amycolatopsis sp. NPDC006125 TaxID=3156730 RepID=UPI0033B9D525